MGWFRRNVTARLRWLAIHLPALLWFYLWMIVFAFVPIGIYVKIKLLGVELNAFCAFVSGGHTDYRLLAIAGLALLWSSFVGYAAYGSWLFFRKTLAERA